jgi:hypothetical protein
MNEGDPFDLSFKIWSIEEIDDWQFNKPEK